jgi:hypothetical protein
LFGKFLFHLGKEIVKILKSKLGTGVLSFLGLFWKFHFPHENLSI